MPDMQGEKNLPGTYLGFQCAFTSSLLDQQVHFEFNYQRNFNESM
jgi:hypothetical protein